MADLSRLQLLEWNQSCAKCEARNGFIIPYIVKLAKETDARVISDLGCGTGYLAREINKNLSSLRPRFQLIDNNSDFLSFAQQLTFGLDNFSFHNINLLEQLENNHIADADISLLVYTFLESPFSDFNLKTILSFAKPSGRIVVVLPDVMEDVIATAKANFYKLGEFQNGHCKPKENQKIDYPLQRFHANRLEWIIGKFLSLGLHLISLERFETNSNKRHFLLDFEKS